MTHHLDPVLVPWRTGRRIGRTIHAQLGPAPGDHDPLIGMMDTAQLAAEAAREHNLGVDRRRVPGASLLPT